MPGLGRCPRCIARGGTISVLRDGFQAFRRTSDEAALLAGCLKDRASPALAAKAHRVRGLREYVEGRDAEAKAAFSAARRVEPGYAFPTSVAAADHPVRDSYGSAPPVPLAQPAPASNGRLEFDGVPGERPVGVPTLAQVVARNGAVLQGGYLGADDTLAGGVGGIAGAKKGKGRKPAAPDGAGPGYVAPAPVPVAVAAPATPSPAAAPVAAGESPPAEGGAPAVAEAAPEGAPQVAAADSGPAGAPAPESTVDGAAPVEGAPAADATADAAAPTEGSAGVEGVASAEGDSGGGYAGGYDAAGRC